MTAWSGLSNFYTGHTLLGVIQLTILLLTLILLLLSKYFKNKSSIDLIALEPIILTCLISITVWWITDILMIMSNNWFDGNGCPLNDDFF